MNKSNCSLPFISRSRIPPRSVVGNEASEESKRNRFISVVIPAKNEEKIIKEAISRIPKSVSEIIVVDNNSTDQTAAIALAAGAKVLFEPRKQNGIGYGFAHMQGIQKAQGEYICGVDGDDTYPTDQIPAIVEYMQSHDVDFVICGRFPLKNPKAISKIRQFGVKVLNLEVFLLYGKRISDILTGMWVIKKSAAQTLNLKEGDWNFSPEIKLAALANPQIRWAEYPIDHFEREGESKQKILKTGLNHFVYILKRRFLVDNQVVSSIRNFIFKKNFSVLARSLFSYLAFKFRMAGSVSDF